MFGQKRALKELIIVQERLNNLYLTTKACVDGQAAISKQLTDLTDLLNKIAGTAEEVERRNTALRRFTEQLNDSVGKVVDSLPKPPAGLTGRGRH